MQPLTPKFRRLLKRLDRGLKDHDLEAFDAQVADQVRQYYVDNDPAYAAALARSEAPAAAAPAAGRRAAIRQGVAAAVSLHPIHLRPERAGDAAAVARLLPRAIAEERRGPGAKPRARPQRAKSKAAKARAAKPGVGKAKATAKAGPRKATPKRGR